MPEIQSVSQTDPTLAAFGDTQRVVSLMGTSPVSLPSDVGHREVVGVSLGSGALGSSRRRSLQPTVARLGVSRPRVP